MFYDGIQFDKDGHCISGTCAIDTDAVNEMTARINAFCMMITEDTLRTPDGGDCWMCAFTTQGKTLGDTSGNHEHLLSHMDEGYIHGSLLVNAMREYGDDDFTIRGCFGLKVVHRFRNAVRRYLKTRLLPGVAVR
jgi:hypothetical protein